MLFFVGVRRKCNEFNQYKIVLPSTGVVRVLYVCCTCVVLVFSLSLSLSLFHSSPSVRNRTSART